MLYETWKMKAWISRGIEYYTVIFLPRANYFLVVPPEDLEATLWSRKGLREKAWNRREGNRAQILKNDIAQGHNINGLKSNGSKMANKSNSTKPWSSICKLNDTPKNAMTVPRHYQKSRWLVPQLLEWSSHSLAYEIQFSSVAQSCPTLCDPMDCSTTGLPVHHQLLEPIQTHVHWVGDAIQPSHPLSSSPLAFNLSQHQGLFKWVSSLELQICFSISPSNEHSGLISFRMDWLNLLAVQGTLKSLLQHHSSKASVLWCSAFL